ncbi:uncharacterized protein LOC121184198 isoform X1 [Toxotes jaculatrix]|uniref:uncharacterized protein LOC121184198 isoform X1 n=1 Tax=Toxotes jaculatrix TaxID=941984 RepID=UPI001B3AD5AF|nr:uncharacterized protein LOC121184198 isoform X1 [Toxotes jaculatrix]
MDLKDSAVQGGVFITHQIHEGKHEYEVKNVVKYKNATGGKMFIRRGDKLMQINGMDLQELTPEELAQTLAEGSPMLKVHKAAKIKEHNKLPSRDEEIFQPFSKESAMLSFDMEMVREKEEDEVGERAGGEDGGVEEDVCQTENEETGENGDLLIITMNKTSISVVRGRGCDTESPCQGCHGMGCNFNDVVMVAESSTVTLVPRGSSFKQDKIELLSVGVEHVATHQYLRSLCSQKTIYASPNPDKMTIYYYKSNIMDRPFRGIPVVLNFSDSNCFLRCCKEGERVFLQVEVTIITEHAKSKS